MAQATKQRTGKKKPARTTKKATRRFVERRPGTLKPKPKQRVMSNAPQRTRPLLKDKSLDAVSVQLQRIEKQMAALKAEFADGRKSKPTDIEARIKSVERKLESRLGRLDERVDSIRAHLLDLEDRVQGETSGGALRALDDDLDNS